MKTICHRLTFRTIEKSYTKSTQPNSLNLYQVNQKQHEWEKKGQTSMRMHKQQCSPEDENTNLLHQERS